MYGASDAITLKLLPIEKMDFLGRKAYFKFVLELVDNECSSLLQILYTTDVLTSKVMIKCFNSLIHECDEDKACKLKNMLCIEHYTSKDSILAILQIIWRQNMHISTLDIFQMAISGNDASIPYTDCCGDLFNDIKYEIFKIIRQSFPEHESDVKSTFPAYIYTQDTLERIQEELYFYLYIVQDDEELKVKLRAFVIDLGIGYNVVTREFFN